MAKFISYKVWSIENNVGDASRFPQGFHVEVYADVENKKIYSSELLGQGSFTRGNTDLCLGSVSHSHPYMGGADYFNYDDIIAAIPRAQRGEYYPLY